MAADTSGKRVVLVVENDANSLHLIRYHLSKGGFQIRSTSNGWEALKRLKDGPVDLILSEVTIPDMDGFTLRERMLLDPGTRDIPFLFLTADTQPDKQVRALRIGVDDYITKPFDPIVLVARVQAVIERHRVHDEMVRFDPLTHLLNRASLELRVTEDLSRLERYQRYATLITLDLDGFARLNAEHGNSMGDLLLTCLAGMITTSIRTMDFAGRYSGAQCVLYLPETHPDGAKVLLERLQVQFGKACEAITSTLVTFSAGIVEAPTCGARFDVLCSRACQAMQLAKHRDTDKIVIWTAELAAELDAELSRG
ncbi:MAG: diguanylate cyclase [Candidatus Hydrogenedentes bacterium]|nr:diguanylate cyclase [Candidatus Hydrogenedentota bacterium]